MGYHRIGCRLWSGLPGCEREPEPNAPDGSNFRNHPLCKPRLLYTGVTFKRLPPGMFFKNHCRRAAWWVIVRLSAAFHPAKRHGEQNAALPRNAVGEGMFRLNTDGAGRAHGGAVL